MYKTITPSKVDTGEFHSYMLGAISPRPIALASTIDKEGNINLSPFSFFNAFSANPPILIFSPARRVKDNTTKHTLDNVLAVKEVVINLVDYQMVEQMSLASTEYEKGTNEFIKAGFEALPSDKIRPPRVANAPAQFECIVKEVIALGDQGGAGNLVICEVVQAHFHKNSLDAHGKVDPQRLDIVGRMGGNWYTRAHKESLFEVEKPLKRKGIGIDQLPQHIKESTVLTGNHLGKLANIEAIPAFEGKNHNFKNQEEIHTEASKLLEQGQLQEAWQVLLSASS